MSVQPKVEHAKVGTTDIQTLLELVDKTQYAQVKMGIIVKVMMMVGR